MVARHPVTAFLLVSLYAVTVGLAPRSGPSPCPSRCRTTATLTESSSASWLRRLRFAVTAAAGGREAVRDLIHRCLRWRVRLRWYAVALLGMPAVTLVTATVLYGSSPLRALSENWPLLFTSYLPTLALMVVLYNVTEEFGFTGFLFARLQDRHGPMRAALVTTVFFWLFHLPTFVIDTGSWALAAS